MDRTDTRVYDEIAQWLAGVKNVRFQSDGKTPAILFETIVFSDLQLKPGLRFLTRIGNSPCNVHGCSVILVFEFRNAMNYWFPRYW